MGRGDHDAAACEMIAHQSDEEVLAFGVERGGRFVQQPDRPSRDQQPRDRKPSALASGEVGGGQMGRMVKTDGGEASAGVIRFAAEKSRQKERFSSTLKPGFSASRWPR